MHILQSPAQNIQKLTYVNTTTNAIIDKTKLLRRDIPPTFPKHAKTPSINPIVTQTAAIEPRVKPTATKNITVSEPRVLSIKISPTITPYVPPSPIPFPMSPTFNQPSISTASPPSTPTKSQYNKIYQDTLANKIMDALLNKPTMAKDNECTRIYRRKFGVPTQHNHFTRSRM